MSRQGLSGEEYVFVTVVPKVYNHELHRSLRSRRLLQEFQELPSPLSYGYTP